MFTCVSARTCPPAMEYFITAAIGIALYNAFETLILIFATFKRYRGCYFWSLLIACTGLIIWIIGYISYFFDVTSSKYVQTAVAVTGWSFFIVAQSLVLWSRLHLVIQSQRILRAVLWMIIVNAIILLPPIVTMAFGNDTQIVTPAFVRGYEIVENIQLLAFTLQECIVSGLYIWGTVRLFKFTPEKRKRNLMLQLFTINVILVLMDIVILSIQYSNHRIVQIGLKSLVSSFKIKLELAILGRLVDFVKGGNENRNQSLYIEGGNLTPVLTPNSQSRLTVPTRTMSEMRHSS